MNIRETFYSTVEAMKGLSADPIAIDSGDAAHNFRAQIVRKGLTVSAFNALETYLEERMFQAVPCLRKSPIKYNQFGSKLRKFLTETAVSGLANRRSLMPPSDRLPYIERNVASLGKFSLTKPSYVAFGFRSKGSNVSEDHVSEALGALGFTKNWDMLSGLCTRLGAGGAPPLDRFKNFARHRNSAAHVVSANIASTDLAEHLETAAIIGVAFDMSATYAVESYLLNTSVAGVNARLAAFSGWSDWGILQPAGTGYAETAPARTQTFRSLETARSSIRRRGTVTYVVRKDGRGVPIELLGSGIGCNAR